MAKSDKRVDLAVPFEEKDQAKAMGARWDGAARTWYVPPGLDLDAFAKWLPTTEPASVVAIAPVYVLTSSAACWRCGREAVVAAFALERYLDLSDEEEDAGETGDPGGPGIAGGGAAGEAEPIVVLSNVTALPPEFLAVIRDAAPLYRLGHSKAGGTYYMNHCTCGAHFGDFFLHHEPGGAFFPMTEAEAAKLSFIELDFPGEAAFAADVAWNSAIVEAYHASVRDRE